MTTLKVLAGPRAFSHIRAHGLNPSDVQSVICASGAAKTLTTIGLDKVILGQWLKNIDHSVDLLGTSAGAFKLAAACRTECTAPRATVLEPLAVHVVHVGVGPLLEDC